MRILKRAAGVLTLAVSAVCCAGACTVVGALTGCSARDASLSVDLSKDPILDAARPGSTRVGEPYSGCDEDDGFAYAGRTYDHPGSRADLIAHYRAAATAHGWQPDLSEATGGPHCFTRRQGPLTLHLSLGFSDAYDIPGQARSKPSEYSIELTASHDGSAWC
ncbi:hypothetical protein [Streptomyces sp. NPDC048606]|uniref:hypothetical protein n=1 Tax=Streptomyces sp. NPDC048606 TaxID=3154726 RepID=UPI003414986A